HTTYLPMPSPFEPHEYASSANDCRAKKSGIEIAMRVTGIRGRIVQHTLNSSSNRRWRGVELQSCTSCFSGRRAAFGYDSLGIRTLEDGCQSSCLYPLAVSTHPPAWAQLGLKKALTGLHTA